MRDLLLTEEFAVQMLPQFVARATNAYGGRRVFFLHVPKTAGTSVRLALADALGVPSLNFYSGHQMPAKGATFWPYLAGHAGIAAFPQAYTGFTVFREPRSRLLSAYRQFQFNNSGPSPRIPLEPQGSHPRKSRGHQSPFEVWSRGKGLRGWFHFDVQARLDQRGQSVESKWSTDPLVLRSMAPEDRLSGLNLGLARINRAAWIHDSDAVLDAIADVSGARPRHLPHENSVEKNLGVPDHVRLTADDMDAFELAVERDQEVIDVAVHLGLVPPLDPRLADEIFERTLLRQNFSLP